MRIFASRMGLGAAVVVVSAALSLSCSVNVLENFADKTSNEALFVDAKTDINNGDYDAAILKFNRMTGSYLTDRHIILWKSTAYAGKCGLHSTLQFVQDFAGVGAGSRLFPFLVNEFKGGTPTRIDACVTAEDLMESIGAIGTRTADENLLLALVSFAKMGNVLSFYTDANLDGVADAGVNPCANTLPSRPTVPGGGDFYDSDLRQFGTGLTLAVANMTAASSMASFGTAALASVPAVPAVYDPVAFSPAEVKGFQTLMKEDAVVGLGTNCSGGVGACNCP